MKGYLGGALLCGAALFASHGDANAMRYGLVSLPDGSTAIMAAGRIERNEAGRLLSALRIASASAPRTLILSSPGGNLEGALQAGEAVRRLGLQTSVGGLTVNSSGQRELTRGVCGSACVFILMAGVTRTIRPGSLVAVHSPQVAVTAAGRRYNLDPATNQKVVRAAEPILRSYAQQMGVSPTLIGVAHAVPHSRARVLSQAEINRYGLVTGRTGRSPANASQGAGRRQINSRQAGTR
jgi:hypothetical protein